VKKDAVVHLVTQFGLSERKACKFAHLSRNVYRYEKSRSDDSDLRDRIKFLASRYPRYGSPRICVLLHREGLQINHKRVERIYREEELSLRRKRKKRIRSEGREKPENPTRPNEQWSMDFMSDSIAGGRRFRTLNIIDEYTHECLAIEVDLNIGGSVVARTLERLINRRGKPERILCDNGPEFTSKALDQWCYLNEITLCFITPGKPIENCFIESFNGRFRDECLNLNWFRSLRDAREMVERWRLEYNEIRPHSALDDMTPIEFFQQYDEGEEKAEFLRASG